VMPEPDDRLDLTGVPCPANFTRAFLRLEGMDEGETLELIVDDGEPIENVPANIKDDGHEVLHIQRLSESSWRVLVRKGEE
jgi:TusA-related sulfurtransferase